MKKKAKSADTAYFTPRATLAAIGVKLRSLGLLLPIKERVQINQKSVKHSPLEKVEDALITILTGAHGLSEINTRLRSDSGLPLLSVGKPAPISPSCRRLSMLAPQPTSHK